MRRAIGILVGVAVLAALLPGSAVAARGGIYRDERSTGTGSPTLDARCDVLSVTAETGKRSLLVTVGMRGPDREFRNVMLNVNTKGGLRSRPEYFVAHDARVIKFTGVDRFGHRTQESVGQGSVSQEKRGSVLRFTVPLALLDRPRSVAVQVQTCAEATTDIAPGKHYFGNPSWVNGIDYQYLRAVPARRVIEGRVMVRCAGVSSCRRLPVKDALVTVSGEGAKRTAATDGKGRYELSVKPGAYTVAAKAGQLRVTTKSQRVDLTRRESARADFQACGLDRSTRGTARLSAVTGGVWRGGNNECLNYLEITWRPSMTALIINWVSAPICTAVGGNYVGEPKLLLKGRTLDPSRQGENVVVKPDEVGFFYPINSVHSGNNVNGTLRANGTGNVHARYVEGLCTYAISNLALKR